MKSDKRKRAMNWKDTNWGSEARAAREIGGRYRVRRYDGGEVTWYGFIEETSYRVQYFPPRERRDPNWKDIPYPRGVPGTLAEAKHMAEEDHERRLRASFEPIAANAAGPSREDPT